MNLILDLKREAHATVYDENGTAKYLVSISKDEDFCAVVYDDLGVTELLKITGKDREFNITAFDVPAGIFILNSVRPLRLSAKAGDWTVTESASGFSIDYIGNSIATAVIKEKRISLEISDDSQLLMLVAVALIMYSAADKGVNTLAEGGAAHAKTRLAKHKRSAAVKKGGAKAITAIANVVMLAAKNTAQAFKKAKKLFENKSIYKFSGKILKRLYYLIALLLVATIVLFAFGIVNTGLNGRMKETTATAIVSADKKTTTAYFNMAGFQYNTKLKGFHFKSGDKFTVYYTENDNHKLTGFYLKHKPTAFFFVLAVVCIVCALGAVLVMLYGPPKFLKSQRFLKAIKKSGSADDITDDSLDDPTVDPKPKIQAVEILKPQDNSSTLHFDEYDEGSKL